MCFLGGGECLPDYLQNSIHVFLKENSTVASNRMVRNKSNSWINPCIRIPVRYLYDCVSKLYFESPFKDSISKSSFFEYTNIHGQFKHPHR